MATSPTTVPCQVILPLMMPTLILNDAIISTEPGKRWEAGRTQS